MATKNIIPKDNNIIDVPIEEAMPDNYLPYAVEVAKDRALPDVRDGLKPVQRRILYGAYLLKAVPDKPYYKSARIVGDILGKFHPHGDSSVYDAMVILAQDFTTRVPLIDGHGNWGSQDGDSAAAMRYTEAKLTNSAMLLLKDIDKDVVPMVPNYSDTEMEPEVLPGRFPNLLVNGAFGIAVGLATNIPPHNLGEVIDGTLALIENPNLETKDIMKYVKGPDLPTGATIIGKNSLLSAYETGEGKVSMRAKAHVEKLNGGKLAIVITEFPYRKSKSRILEVISEMTADKKHSKVLEGIIDIRDESDREGTRAVIELKKSVSQEEADKILRYLYKRTDLQCNLSFNMVALHNGKPETMTLKNILTYYVAYQKEIVTKRTYFELNKAKERYEIVEGFIKAIGIMDELIKTIRASKSKVNARDNIMAKYGFSVIQADAILELMLYRLTGLEIDAFMKEYKTLQKTIDRLSKILMDEKELLKVIKEELKEIKEKFSDVRRTNIIDDDEEAKIDTEDFVVEEDIVITLSKDGFTKRIPQKSYNRSSMDTSLIEYREGDSNEFLIFSNTKDTIIFFTDKGNMHQLKGNNIPEYKWKEKGERLDEILKGMNLQEEKIISCYSIPDFSAQQDIILLTSTGGIKKTALSSYSTTYSKISASKLREEEKLVMALLCNRNREAAYIKIITKNGLSFDIEEPELDAIDRNLSTQQFICLCKNDEVISYEMKDQFEFKSFFVSINSRAISVSKRDNYNNSIRTITNSSEILGIVTDLGRVFSIPSAMIQNLDSDMPLNKIIDIFDDENVINIFKTVFYNEYDKAYIFTKKGVLKAVDFTDLKGLKGESIIKFKYEDDKAVSFMLKSPDENSEAVVITSKAMCIRFSLETVAALSLNAMGIIGITLKEDDEVVFSTLINTPQCKNEEVSLDHEDNRELILKSAHDNVKKVKIKGIKLQNRAGRGLNVMLIVLDDHIISVKLV